MLRSLTYREFKDGPKIDMQQAIKNSEDWVETNSPITIDDIPSIDDDQDQGSAFASASASASASGSASENNTPKKNKGVSSAETINGSKKLKAK